MTKKMAGATWQTPVFVLLIIALGFLVYANALGGKFLYDDDKLIRDNIYIKSWDTIGKIFSKDIGAGAGVGYRFNFYRPVQMLLYMAIYSLCKLNPFGYHLASVLIHIAAALSIYFFANLLFNNKTLSFFAGMLFVAHPIHTEAVSYIAGVADPLAALFILLSFIFYIKDNMPAMMLCYAFACLSKEYSLILPALIALYCYVFKKELKLNRLLPMLGVVLIYAALRISLKFSISGTQVGTTFFQRVPGFFAAITNYIRLLFLPFGLHMEYGLPTFSPFDIKAVIGLGIVSFMLWYAFKRLSRDKLTSFAIFWFMVTILPVANLLPINAYMAEHWLYLPSIGFFFILANILSLLCRDHRTLGVTIAALLIAFYSVLTFRQNIYWKDPALFYEATLKYTPDNAGIYTNLGNTYAKKGDYGKALEAYQKALELKPASAGTHSVLGNLYARTNDPEKAVAEYKKAIEIDPHLIDAYNNLATVYYDMNMQEEAIATLQKALSLDPDSASVYNNLGNAYAAQGEKEEAIKAYKKAIEINPGFAEAYNNLGSEYPDQNEAIKAYKKAIEIKPDYAEAYYNLSKACEKLGMAEEAEKYYKKAKTLKPGLP